MTEPNPLKKVLTDNGLTDEEAGSVLRGFWNRLTVVGLGRCDVCDGPLHDDHECPEHGRRRREGTYSEDPT